jgi:hypothetical protein
MRDLGLEDWVLAFEDVTTDRLVSLFRRADSRVCRLSRATAQGLGGLHHERMRVRQPDQGDI